MNIQRSIVLAALLGLWMTPEASAAPGGSWNLSRDMIVDWNFGPNSNPLSPASWWTFMGSSHSNPLALCDNNMQPIYTALPNYNNTGTVSRWDGLAPVQEVGLVMDPSMAATPVPTGVPYLHPGNNFTTAVRWQNPMGSPWQTFRVLGRFTHVDPNNSWGMADGVRWFVVKVSGCFAATLSSGFIQSTALNPANDTGVFLHTGIYVGPGESLYFIVHRNGNFYFDTTALDVLITSM